MKPFFINIFLFTALAVQYCCTAERGAWSRMTVLVDVTEPDFAAHPALVELPATILEQLDIDPAGGRVANGGDVRLCTVDELSQSPCYRLTLPPDPGNPLTGNPYVRQDQVRHWADSLAHCVRDLTTRQRFGRDASQIYQHICRELRHLTDTSEPAPARRVMIIASDLLEHSKVFSAYRQNPEAFERDPAAYLDAYCALPDLTGVDIYLVCLRTEQNDERVNRAEAFWRRLFESRGARVHSVAGNRIAGPQ